MTCGWTPPSTCTPASFACDSIPSTANLITSAHVEQLAIEVQLVAGDARDVEQVADQARLCFRVAADDREAVTRSVGADAALLQHPRPAEDRVERRPQLVRQRGEELVLQAVGLMRGHVQPGIFDGDASAARNFLRERQIGGVEPPRRVAGGHERDRADDLSRTPRIGTTIALRTWSTRSASRSASSLTMVSSRSSEICGVRQRFGSHASRRRMP